MAVQAKYFSCMDPQEALAPAGEYFACAADALEARMVTEPWSDQPGLALVLHYPAPQDKALARNMSAFYSLFYEEDGVWLELYPPAGSGRAVEVEALLRYLGDKRLQSVRQAQVTALIGVGYGRTMIAPAQQEYLLGEEINFTFLEDDMRLKARLVRPEPGGALLTVEDIRERARMAGAVFGLDDEVVSQMAAEHDYFKSYSLAAGQKAIPGKNGELIYHFRTQLTGLARELDGGKVDFHRLDIFEPVEAGQLLVTAVPAVPGRSGFSVRGKETPAGKVKSVQLPKGKNVRISEEGDKLFAATSGMVELQSGRVVVSNTYVLNGSCDMGTGNIDFDGNVQIKGGVISNMVIRATGSIVVSGVVEGAELYAGGNVELKTGMQGMDRGRIVADGMVRANFLERCTVIAGGMVVGDTILHSNIECGDQLVVSGKRGSITGGSCRVANEIRAVVLGAVSGTSTMIEVGVMPQTRQRIAFLSQDIGRLETELDKLNKLEAFLSREPQLDEAKQKLFASVVESKVQNIHLVAEYTEELSKLQRQVLEATEGKVHVRDTTYPGTRIAITSARLTVREPIPYATFVYRDEEVVFHPYEG